MSVVYYYRCDGKCGRQRRSLPDDWKRVNTWRDGSMTEHYCPKCQTKAKR